MESLDQGSILRADTHEDPQVTSTINSGHGCSSTLFMRLKFRRMLLCWAHVFTCITNLVTIVRGTAVVVPIIPASTILQASNRSAFQFIPELITCSFDAVHSFGTIKYSSKYSSEQLIAFAGAGMALL